MSALYGFIKRILKGSVNLRVLPVWIQYLHVFKVYNWLLISQYRVLVCLFRRQLRNEIDFWNVHGIMNTSGLLQS